MRASGLIIGGELVAGKTYFSNGGYRQDLLKEWHAGKRRIRCACRKDDPRPELHVRRTPSGSYTLANNPEQSDKHQQICPFYGEVSRGQSRAPVVPPVMRDGDTLIVQVSLFSERVSDFDDLSANAVGERHVLPKARPLGGSGDSQTERQARTRTFAEFIHDWYLLAMEWIGREKKEPTPSTVLYYMWLCMIKHRIRVGNEDFYYHAYVPNDRFTPNKGRKIVIGYVRNIERVIGGERWTLTGLKQHQMTVLVQERHIPKYHTLNKLAALSIYFEQGAEPVIDTPAKAWRITKGGCWLHSDAEWKLLRALDAVGLRARRPETNEVLHGYSPDFVVDALQPPLLIDVLDPPDEKSMVARARLLDEDTFRLARHSSLVRYLPWRAGDPIDLVFEKEELV